MTVNYSFGSFVEFLLLLFCNSICGTLFFYCKLKKKILERQKKHCPFTTDIITVLACSVFSHFFLLNMLYIQKAVKPVMSTMFVFISN